MQGKLQAQVRKDAQKFVTSGGFENDITLTSPDGSKTAAIKGLATGRWQNLMNSDGQFVNSQSYHIGIPEQALTDLEYPVRSLKSNKVSLVNHRVTVKDNTGTDRTFIINECLPNSTTGLIMCILSEAKS